MDGSATFTTTASSVITKNPSTAAVSVTAELARCRGRCSVTGSSPGATLLVVTTLSSTVTATSPWNGACGGGGRSRLSGL
jgi:hypothetical protein